MTNDIVKIRYEAGEGVKSQLKSVVDNGIKKFFVQRRNQ